jgi:hypothetical protein
MSYVGDPFSHDLFVTYSHGHVEGSDASRLKGWSLAFAKELELELRMFPRIGDQLRVFLDEHPSPGSSLSPLSPLTEQLRSKVSASAILTVLLTPHYLASSWCRNERDWWLEGQKAKNIPHSDRIALARVWPLDKGTPWPDLLVDGRGEPPLGFWFHDPASGPDAPWPYEYPAPDNTSKGPFRAELLRLVTWLVRRLDELKEELLERRRVKQAASGLASARQLYLYGRAEHRAAWEDAWRRLDDADFAVFPAQPHSVETDLLTEERHRRDRLKMMKDCEAVLLVGSPDGVAVDTDLQVMGRHEVNLARASARRPIPCALLDTVGEPIATPFRRKLARRMQVDWIDGTRDPWVPQVRSWLQEKSAALLVDP